MDKGVYALGNFDGVHRGHREVIETAVAVAQSKGLPSRVLTFEPHPREVFCPDTPPFRLTPFDAKRRLILSLGVDEVVPLPFTPEMARISAEVFIHEILVRRFDAMHVVAGHDFAFGCGRSGNMSKLAEVMVPLGVGVTEVPAVMEDGEILSSSLAREALAQGTPEKAARILGRPWSVSGVIAHGAGLGGKIGVHTANIELGSHLRPKFGVYAVKAGKVGSSLPYYGVANIGVRPTVNGGKENMETHLFDFSENIYGQEWEFALIGLIRPEKKFDGIDSLKKQIANDITDAKRLLQ